MAHDDAREEPKGPKRILTHAAESVRGYPKAAQLNTITAQQHNCTTAQLQVKLSKIPTSRRRIEQKARLKFPMVSEAHAHRRSFRMRRRSNTRRRSTQLLY